MSSYSVSRINSLNSHSCLNDVDFEGSRGDVGVNGISDADATEQIALDDPTDVNVPIMESDYILPLYKSISFLLQDKGFNFPWEPSGTSHGFSALRYQIAFASYAISHVFSEFTPAYSEHATHVLKSAIEQMLNPIVWTYWLIPRECGHPWYSVCLRYNYSMSDLYPAHNHWFPDVLFRDNVMYSGHLFKMLCLYQTISGDDVYASIGWNMTFDGMTVHYDLHRLRSVIEYQLQLSGVRAFPCEPYLIYAVCNSINFPALRLYYNLFPLRENKLSTHQLRAGFLSALAAPFKRTPGSSFFENVLLHRKLRDNSSFRAFLFQPSYIESISTLFGWGNNSIAENILRDVDVLLDNVNGGLGLDSWVLSQMQESDLDGTVLAAAQENLNTLSYFTEYGDTLYINEEFVLAGRKGFTTGLSSAFALTQLNETLKKKVFEYMTLCHAKNVSTRDNVSLFLYQNESACSVCVVACPSNPQTVLLTSLMLTGLARRDVSMALFNNGTIMARRHSHPSLVHMHSSDTFVKSAHSTHTRLILTVSNSETNRRRIRVDMTIRFPKVSRICYNGVAFHQSKTNVFRVHTSVPNDAEFHFRACDTN